MRRVFEWESSDSDVEDKDIQWALESSMQQRSSQRRSQRREQLQMDRDLQLQMDRDLQLQMDRDLAHSLMEDGLSDYEIENLLRPIEGAAGAAAGAAAVRVPRAAASGAARAARVLPRCKDFKNRNMMKKELDKPPKVSYKVADLKDELCRKLIASGRARRYDPSPEQQIISAAREELKRREKRAREDAARAQEVAREQLRGQGNLQVKEVDRIPNRCYDPIVENGIIDYEEGVFQFVYGRIDIDGNFLINEGNNSGCLDRESLTSMMNQRDARGNYLNWFYECTGKVDDWGQGNTGDEILVKLAFAEGYTVYIPKPLLDSMLANNIYRVGVVTTQRTFNRSATYLFARRREKDVRGYDAGVNNDFMSANHCQNGSNITISTLVELRERGERRDAGTRRRTRRMKLQKQKKTRKYNRSSKTAF